MVYCGKPSRGCQMCRTRRIKCDEAKPMCGQCQKSRRQCPGYKDDFDLVFRNETQATERRARRSTNSKKLKFQNEHRNRHGPQGTASIMGSSSYDGLVPGSDAGPLGAVPVSVSVPLEIQAFHYFLASYVLIPQIGITRGHLSYVLPLLKGESGGTQFSTSFTAVALASFSHRPGASRLLLRASQEYSKALIHVNKSLQNPTTRKSNQTLASILLLGLYETITLRRPNLGSWGTHIEGAVMLIRMRGRKQLRDPVGKSLFVAVRSQMLINCMSASKAPDLGVEWWTRGAASDDVAGHEASRLNLLTCELRADLNQAMALMPRLTENFDKTFELIRRAQEIEQGFLDWEASLPDEWRFKTVAWADAIPDSDLSISEVYPGKVDMFSDLFVASQWNMARVSRLILSGIIIRCAAWTCAPVDYRTTSHYAQASRIGIEMINDIVASVPYHLGWRDFRSNPQDLPSTGNISSFVCGQSELGTGKPLGAYFLIWPVFTSTVSDFATDAQRKYIIGRMKYMTDIMGINGPSVLTQFQLRLPSMIVKRDLMCMFAPPNKPGGFASKSSATPPGQPAAIFTSSRTSSFSTYRPSISDSRSPSISSSPMTVHTSSLSPIGSGAKEEEEEEILEAQAQMGPDYEKKKAEKEAFSRTYMPAIKETSGDNVEYLHKDSGDIASPIKLEGD